MLELSYPLTEQERAELDAWLSKAVDREDELSSWERRFVSSCIDKLERFRNYARYSVNEAAKLQEIREKLDR